METLVHAAARARNQQRNWGFRGRSIWWEEIGWGDATVPHLLNPHIPEWLNLWERWGLRQAAASPCPPRPEDRGVPRSLGKGQFLMSNDRRERRPWSPTPPEHQILEAYPVQSPNWWKHRESKLKKSSKNSEKNHECTSRFTPSTYKISWSNSSFSNSYKKDKFGLHLNVNDCQKICFFCNCKCKMNLIVEIYM